MRSVRDAYKRRYFRRLQHQLLFTANIERGIMVAYDLPRRETNFPQKPISESENNDGIKLDGDEEVYNEDVITNFITSLSQNELNALDVALNLLNNGNDEQVGHVGGNVDREEDMEVDINDEGNSQTTVTSTPALAASSTSLPGGGAVSPYSTPAATDGGSAPGQTHSGGSSQTPVASTPAPPACNASLPDDDTVSRYRNLSAAEKGRRLIEATKEGAAGELRALLAAGADVGARGAAGETALHWAAKMGHADAASCLLAGGADVGARSDVQSTPLHWAAYNGRTAVVRLLAAASADLNPVNRFGRTPLHYAAMKGQTEAAAALLEAGADRGLRDQDGNTPLDSAANQELRQLLTES